MKLNDIVLVTNNKKILTQDGTPEQLHEAVKIIKEKLCDFLEKPEVLMEFHETPYPYYTLPESVDYAILEEALDGEFSLKARALGEEEIEED